MARCVPGPNNSCSIVWQVEGDGPNARLVGYVRTAAKGGLTEFCTEDLNRGLALNLLGSPANEEPTAGAVESYLRISDAGQLFVKRPAKKRVTFPTATNAGVTGGETVLLDRTITIDTTAYTAATCWEITVDVQQATINYPTAGVPTVTVADHTVAFAPETHAVPEDRHEVPNVQIVHDHNNKVLDLGADGIDQHDHGGGFINNHNHGGDHFHDHGGDFTHDHGGDQTLTHGTGVLNVDTAISNASMGYVIGPNYRAAAFAADRFFNTYSGRLATEVTLPAGATTDVAIQAIISATANIAQAFDASSGTLVVCYQLVECAEDC